jgi:plastocyanin
MTRKILGGTATVAVLVIVAACFSEHGATTPGTSCTIGLDPSQYGSTIVAIQDFLFLPTPIHVRAGGKVTWLNCEATSGLAHTATADGGAWDSNVLAPGSSFTFTFPAAGTFAYHCDIHPSMIAAVIVDP